MKSKGLLVFVRRLLFVEACLLVGSAGMAKAALPVDDSRTIVEIKEVIDLYRQSGDSQDPALAERTLHSGFALYYQGADGWVRSDRASYIAAIKGKVIGGQVRSMVIDRIEVTGPVASAHVRFVTEGAIFDQFVNLVKSDGGWQIVGLVLNYIPS